MSAKRDSLVDALMKSHGRTYSGELGIDLSKNTPSPLFRWLCASILMSARISADKAVSAAQGLADAGWTTAPKLADSTWRERVDVLNRSGYARFDESTASMLGDMVERLMDEYDGDLRSLRRRADKDPAEMRKHLKAFKGLGDVGVDIFFREAQIAWEELYPFADRKARSAAKELGLPDRGDRLAKLVERDRVPTLVAALVRADLAKDLDRIEKRAA